MASPISSTLRILLLFSVFTPLLFSNKIFITASSPSSSSLIQWLCARPRKAFDPNFCIQILQSDKQIVSSAKKLFDISIAIMKAGISNATNMYTYLHSMSKKPKVGSEMKAILHQCETSYSSILGSFRSALTEVKDFKEYQTATYDLLIASTDNLEQCRNAVAGKKITDEVILIGNKVVPVYGLSAFEAVSALEKMPQN